MQRIAQASANVHDAAAPRPPETTATRHGLAIVKYFDREARRARQQTLYAPGAQSRRDGEEAKRRYHETMAGLTNGRGA